MEWRRKDQLDWHDLDVLLELNHQHEMTHFCRVIVKNQGPVALFFSLSRVVTKHSHPQKTHAYTHTHTLLHMVTPINLLLSMMPSRNQPELTSSKAFITTCGQRWWVLFSQTNAFSFFLLLVRLEQKLTSSIISVGFHWVWLQKIKWTKVKTGVCHYSWSLQSLEAAVGF